MTLKIETAEAGEAAVLRLAGRIQSADVNALRARIRGRRAGVALDLDEVTLVDLEVVDFLAACEGEGVELLHCPPYIRAWMGTQPRPRRPSPTPHDPKEAAMPTIVTPDGAQLFYKDWGAGQPVVFSHGWPLNADAWDDQLFFFASHGYRAIAHDRRGHGRSTQSWAGNDMDTYADDLAALAEALDLRDAVHVGHSTGGGEVVRYIARHGTSRVAGAVLVSAIPPLMLRTPDNPEGVPMEVFDQIRAGVAGDRSQFWKELSAPFYGANREGAKVSQGVRDAFWLLSMQCGLAAAFDCIEAFSESDFRQDLGKMDVPTLVIHGDDDQIVPIAVGGLRSSKLIPGATLKVYPGAPHGLMSTHREQFNADLLEFARRVAAQPVGAAATPSELAVGIGRVVSDS